MYDYNASYLNEQETLLEEFHKIQKYLNEHPLYQIYQSSADYVAGVNEYNINEVSVRQGSKLGVGDVVLFSNVYYGVITEINEVTGMFTIAAGISFRGETGATGPRGGIGPRGLPGEDGNNALEYLGNVVQITYDGDEFNEALTFNNSDFNRTPVIGDGFLFMYHLNESNLSYIVNGRVTAVGTDTCQVTITPEARQEVTGPAGQAGQTGATGETGKEGLSIYLYDGELSSSVTSVTLSQINIPTGRTLAVGDILFSSLASTYGAMSIVTDTTGTVDFVGTLAGGGGGGVSDVQINGTTIVSNGVANIPYATDTRSGVIASGTASQRIGGYLDLENQLQLSGIRFRKTYGASGGYLIKQSKNSSTNQVMGVSPSASNARNAGVEVYDALDDNKSVLWAGLYAQGYIVNGKAQASQGVGSPVNYKIFLPETDGTFMATPSTWSTGTSGSVTLPSDGLYEVKVTKTFGEYDVDIVGIINFAKDGTKGASSTSMTYVGTAGLVSTMIIADPTGVLTFLDPATGEGDVSITISYRKIGIA